MIAPPIPLVWAKLEAPRLPTDAVIRPALIDRLAAPGAALTAIVAPAGYGKTTVATQLVERIGADRAWVSLEPADDEPVRFWTYVAAALCSAGVTGADETYGLLTTGVDAVPQASLALRARIEAHGRPVVLVLDDMHWLSDAVVESTMGDWLRHPLANLRIVCTSRSNLPLPVGRLRGQARLTEARADELAFDHDESAALLATTFGLADLTDAQLAAVRERTEGWPVGLYLAGMTLRDVPDIDSGLVRFTGDGRHLDEYLAAEAMDGISDGMRAFVLATSVVPVLYPDLCDAVTASTGSLGMLRTLANDSLFIAALDDGATVFRYHPLFREHLHSALLQDHPDQVAELHARAADWHERRGQPDAAIEHATAAGQLERAERLMLDLFLPYANAGHFGTTTNWVDALGPHEERCSEIAAAMSWSSLNLRRHADVDHWLAIATANARSKRERRSIELQRPAVLVHRARHLGDVGAMRRYAVEALDAADRLSRDDDALYLDEGRRAAHSSAASAAFWAGDVDAARRHLVEALEGRTSSLPLEETFCYQYLAMLDADAGDAGDAETALAHADQALAQIDPSLEPIHLPTLAHLARSIALIELGRPADAADALAEARRIASIRREPLYDAAIELQQARLHHVAGDQEAARAAIRCARSLVDALPDARFDDRIRAVENATRFVTVDAEALPVGARELTDRERAVLELLPHRLGRRELARQLHVSENTIKSHLTSIRHKLAAPGRSSIVDRAVELGLLTAPDEA